jgi:MYXO-CTERM domain-containing protein
MLANPGYGIAGGFQPEVKQFLLVANTSRNLRTDGSAEDKLAFDLVLAPAVVPSGDDPNPTPDPDPTPDPMPDPNGNPDPDSSGAQVGGCSTGGSTSGGSIILLGAALGFAIRRRRSN